MRILILGSQGFIGSSLVSFFLKENYAITGCDLIEHSTDQYDYQKISILSTDFETIFAKYQFDVCINASGSGNVPYSLIHPLSDFEANTLASIKILDGIRKNQPSCKYLHISSAAVYGNPQSLPISEDTALIPLSPYGWHKLMSEQICKEYLAIYQLPIAIIRPFSVYGPGLRKQLIWDLYKKIISNNEIFLHGTGKESRDFIYIEDMMQAINKILVGSSFNGEIYNIASGVETTIQELANAFQSIIGNKCAIHFNNIQRPGDPLNWKADIKKLRKCGFQPSYSIEEGLEKTYQWLQKNA